MASGFRALLPDGIAVREFVGVPDADAWQSLPEPERGTAAPMVAARRAEFALGRQLAREAMVALGCPPLPVPRRADRLPAWPAPLVGAITHCDGLVAVAVARQGEWRAVGIDAEVIARLDGEILEHVGTAAELAVAAAGDPADVPLEAAVRFAAKECVQKAFGPLLGEILPFSAVELREAVAGRTGGALALHVQHPRLAACAGTVIPATWAVDGPWVRAAIAVR